MEWKSKTRAGVIGGVKRALEGLPCCAIVGVSLIAGIARADYGGGDGTADNPYIIREEVDMNSIGANPDDWDKHFRLASDIDLGGYHNDEFNIIGNAETPFTGVFDGNDRVISNFSYTCVDTNSVGLFGCISYPASIEGLELADPNIDAGNGDCVGALVGRSEPGGGGGRIGYPYIANCRVVGGVIKGNNHIGTMVGSNEASITQSYCIATEVYGNENVGGFAGASHTPIRYGYSICSVSGNNNIGGFVGYNLSDGGYDYEGIEDCYSAGQVSGAGLLGGFVALNEGTVGDCFWDIDAAEIDYSDGGIAKSTVQMMDIKTYEAWACDLMWTIDNGNDYPRPAIEGKVGELIEPTGYGGGTGEPNDPYQIYTAEELDSIGRYPCHSDKHFILMNDIDLCEYTGSSFHRIRLLYGSFEGNNQTISHFNYVYDGEISDVGLFSRIQGDVRNLVLVEPNIDAEFGTNVGALAGAVGGCCIEGCKIVGGSVTGKENVGGLIGKNDGYNDIKNCSSTATIIGSGNSVGGLIGTNHYGDISLCLTDSNITGIDNVGGLVGMSNDMRIRDSYSQSNVNGIDSVGGLVGYAWNEDSTIIQSYFAGDIVGDANTGGLIGKGLAVVSDSYWDSNKNPELSSIGGGLPKTTDEMKDSYTFRGWASIEPNTWTIDDGNDYPRLSYEGVPGQLITLTHETYGGGTGEPNAPYLIYTPGQLNSIGLFEEDWDKHFRIMSDIDMSEYDRAEYNVIGHRIPFTGSFDGNGFSIRNFNFSVKARQYNGLIGRAGEGALFEDIVLIDPNICVIGGTATGLIGALDGDYAIVQGCRLFGGKVIGGSSTGGIVGMDRHARDSEIKSCSVSSDIYGTGTVGGIAGFFSHGTVSECFSTGSVNGSGTVGGLIGQVNAVAYVTNCYSRSDVTGDRRVGGLAGSGYNRFYQWGNKLEVLKCYSTGRITGNEDIGGLVGFSERYHLRVRDSFWDVNSSEVSYSSGGTKLTTQELLDRSTYVDAGWDFDDVWDICQSISYPRLRWEILPADIACPYGVNNIDFAHIAANWKTGNCDSSNGFCQGTDLDKSGAVDAGDVAVLSSQWLDER